MPHPHARRPLAAVLATAALIATALIAAPTANAVPTNPPLIINEVYGGGGNAGAPLDRDFVELYNPGPSQADLTGWSVQYAATSGTTWIVTPLSGVLPAGDHLLVGHSPGANGAVVDADISGTTAMAAANGKVALVSLGGALSGCATSCSSLPQVIDFVGYGTANEFLGLRAAPALSNSTSASRDEAHTHSGDNSADFAAGAPSPTASTGWHEPEPEPEPEPELVAIADIQGTGTASPLAGTTVKTRGIVTAAYPTGGFAGYVIQTPGTGGDLDPAAHSASDAVFVFSRSTVDAVEPGDFVEVTGAVTEFFGLTEITVASSSGLKILTDAADPVIPAPVEWPATAAEREPLESMLVQPQGTYTVSNTFAANRFGEVGLAFGDRPLWQPTDLARPGSAEAAAIASDNAARAVTLDDGATTEFTLAENTGLTPAYISLEEPVVVGAEVTFSQPVIVDWRNNAWKLNPTSPVVGDGSGIDPVVFSSVRTPAPAAVGGDVTVASFNVLNYFTTLGTDDATCVPFRDRTGDGVTVSTGCDQRGAWDAADLARQQEKIVAAINTLDASVVGLMEIENSAKLGEQADEATATLVAALNAAAGSQKWAHVPSSPELPDVALQDVITNAIIYQPAEATPSGASRALGTQSGDDQAFGNAREPLAQAFRPAAGGERFLFVVNHFKSKGSAGPWPGDRDAGDGQSLSNESRVRQATALRDWVASIEGDVDSVVLAGDFNSYGQEDPLHVLYDAGFSDAEQTFDIDTASYSFSGLSGSLDHILLSEGAHDRATGGDIWNINSGEAISLEYSRYNYHGTLFHAPDPFRSSDHDPVVVGLAAGVDERAQTRTTLVAVPPVHINRVLPATLAAVVTASGRPVADGTVEFHEADTVIGTASVSRGVATLKLPKVLSRGAHAYTAVFVPADPELQRGSTSNRVKVSVIL